MLPYREELEGLWNDADNTKQLIVQHTTESEGGNTSVINYLEATQRGSYQTMVDFDGEEVRMVPDNRQAWAAMNQGNRRGLHTCVMGRAAYSRATWLSKHDLLERTAMRYAEWHRLYNIPLVKIGPADIRANKRGICGHVDITNAFHESDHTDPGGNFPYDFVIARAKEILAGKPAANPNKDWIDAMAQVKSLVDGKNYSPEQMLQFIDFHTYHQTETLDKILDVLKEISTKLSS